MRAPSCLNHRDSQLIIPRRLKVATVVSTSARLAFRLDLIQEFAQTIKVFALAARDFSILRGCERRDLINEDRDGSLASRHQPRVAGDNEAKACARVRDRMCGRHDFLLKLVQPEIHDVEKQFFLAVDVMVEPCFRHAERVGDVVDGGGIIALTQYDLRSRAVNFSQALVTSEPIFFVLSSS